MKALKTWFLILFIGFIGVHKPLNAQVDLSQTVELTSKHQYPSVLLDTLAKLTQLQFSYKSEVLNKTFNLKSGKYVLQFLIDYICIKNNCKYIVLESTVVIKPVAKKAAEKHVIHGRVIEQASGEAIPNAQFYIVNSNYTFKANRFGYFSFSPPPREEITLFCYKNQEAMIEVKVKYTDSFIVIAMPTFKGISPVTIQKSKKSKSIIQPNNIGLITFSGQNLEKIPAFLGEPDVMNALTYMPSVANGTEGSNGLFIRGGSPDQNLITLDGAMLYNPTHFFGLFSPFNVDAINHISMQKSGFDASVGGRLSSHIDINLKDGNLYKAKHHASISPLALSVSSNGPIIKGKTTYLVSARRSYFDWVITPLLSDNNSVGFFFVDFNAKITHRFSSKHSISVSTFAFEDKAFNKSKFQIEEKINIKSSEENNQSLAWGNRLAQLNYLGQLGPKLFLNADVYYTSFSYKNNIDFTKVIDSAGIKTATNSSNYAFNSDVGTISVNFKFDWNSGKRIKSKFGLGYFYHSFLPSSTQFINSSSTFIAANNLVEPNIFANELYAFYNTDIVINKKLLLQTGVRLGSYFTANAAYFNPQPRIALRYILPKNWVFKPSFAHMVQYLHFATNNTIGVPVDLWLPVTKNLLPETSNQWSALFQKTASSFGFSAEVFYKTMHNLIDYAEGIEYLGTSNFWENKFVQGSGETYGIDFFAEKELGKVTGWAGYTFSFNNRQFDSINNGNKYPFKYDRRHSINLVLSVEIKSNKSFYMSWAFGSGAAITLPIARYPSANGAGEDIYIYGERNANRLRDYHRLDVGFKSVKKREKYTRIWNFSVYNLYNQQNPFYIVPGADDQGNRAFVQVSLLPFIPSINYRIEFN